MNGWSANEIGLGLQAFVDMPGWTTGETLFRALQTIDLGVSCDPKNSYNDACTMNKVLEYMAFGKPQVMFDLVESRASAQDAGYYVTESSSSRLAEAIQHLLDNPALRQSMGQIGAERFAKWVDWGRSVEQLEQELRPGCLYEFTGAERTPLVRVGAE